MSPALAGVRQGAGKALSVDKLSLSNMSLLSLRAIRSDTAGFGEVRRAVYQSGQAAVTKAADIYFS